MTARALDDLARALAEPTSRRGAVRLLVGVVAAVTLPAARPAGGRAAGTLTCLLPSQPVPCTCGGKFNLCCSTRDRCDCFPDRAVCTKLPCKPRRAGLRERLLQGERVLRRGHRGLCCASSSRCGSTCCTAAQTCVKGACCPNTRVCGDTCCASGKTCTFKRGAAGSRLPPGRPRRRRSVAGQSAKFCCPPGTVRVSGPDVEGRQGCCPPGDQSCCEALAPLVPTKSKSLYTGAIFCVRGKPAPLL